MKKDLFKNIVGQETAKLSLTDWYENESQPLLIYGPSGYGKTNFAKSLGAILIDTTQLRSDRVNSLLKPIKEAEDGDILFFDEIHSLQPKILERLYQIIDTGKYYDTDLCMNIPIPNVRFLFATNIIAPLPVAFVNRTRLVELQDYTNDELKEIIKRAYPSIKGGLESIVKASKGVPRTALSISKSIIAGAKTDGIEKISEEEVNTILESRMGINPATGLNSKEYMIIQKTLERGSLSTTAVANLLKTTMKDAQTQYIDKLRSAGWLAVCSRGVIPGEKAHFNYKLFIRRKTLEEVMS